MNFSVVVLLAVFASIALRQFIRIRVGIWQIMLAGATAVVLTGQLSHHDALRAINTDVMLFLFWMFLAGRAIEESGYLERMAFRLFRRANNADSLLFMVIFACGLLSGILMNDTVAIVATPLMLTLSRQHGMSARPLLLALSFAVTTGSVMSPLGNPQNLLIALETSRPNAFIPFGRYLVAPTIVCLFVTFLFLKFRFREHFGREELVHDEPVLRDERLAMVSRVSVVALLAATVLNIALTAIPGGAGFPVTWIAACAGLPVLLLSSRRVEMLRTLDWTTLLFFAAMFVLMESVWQSGFFQGLFSKANIDLSGIPSVMATGILLSQLVSNVPLVALCLPILIDAGASPKLLMALAAASTIAGNLLIFGAASNVIIIQNAESRGDEGIGFLDFAKAGIPLTLIQTAIYGLAFALVP